MLDSYCHIVVQVSLNHNLTWLLRRLLRGLAWAKQNYSFEKKITFINFWVVLVKFLLFIDPILIIYATKALKHTV